MVTTTLQTTEPATQESSTNNTPALLKETGNHAAQDNLPGTPTKHARSLELSSINGILRQHARQRLYVRPLHWTAEHLRLLGCVFTTDRHAAVGKTRKETVLDEKLVRSTAETAAFLRPGVRSEIKAVVIRDMLADYGLSRVWYASLLFLLLFSTTPLNLANRSPQDPRQVRATLRTAFRKSSPSHRWHIRANTQRPGGPRLPRPRRPR